MRKIFVIHENQEWTVHLQNRLEELGLPFELWHLHEGVVDLSTTPPEGVFYNRISASSHTRSHRYAPEFSEAVIAWLERHGRVVVNGSRALRLEISKANQYMSLEQAGITTPKTLVACGKKQIIEAASALGSDAFITKHNRAGKGQGVHLFHSLESLRDYVFGNGFDEPIDGITLVQQYIKAPEPYIVRHEFIGGKFFYAVKVDTSDGFELCPADVCSVDDLFCPTSEAKQQKVKFEILQNYRPDFIDTYETFLSENNILVAGIEVISDSQGNTYTYDVNTNTNYNSDAEAKAGRYGMLELARYLASLL